MKKTLISLALSLAAITSVSAQDITVSGFRMAGPYYMNAPIMVDSVKHDNSKYDTKNMLNNSINLDVAKKSEVMVDSILPKNDKKQPYMALLYTTICNKSYAKAKINISKLKNYKLLVDGKEQSAGSEIALTPRTHEVILKCLVMPEEQDTASVKIESKSQLKISAQEIKGGVYHAEAGMLAKTTYSIMPSNDGLYYIEITRQRFSDNNTTWTYLLKDAKTNATIITTTENLSWAPSGNHEFIKYKDTKEGKQLILVDAKTLNETILCKKMPKDHATILPNLKQAVISKAEEGPKADDDKHLYLHPEDRVPGWRDRTSLEIFDFETCLSTPVTYGNRALWLADVTADSRYLFIVVNTEDIETMRPSSYRTVVRLDLETMQTDTIIEKDGFLSGGNVSPDGKTLLVMGSPEFGNRIGCTLPKDKYPNMYDYQLYLVDVDKAINKAEGAISPVTKNFNPSIEDYQWSAFDNCAYFTAQDKDYIRLYQLNPKTQKIKQVELPVEVVNRFSVSDKSPLVGVVGSGIVNLGQTFILNTKSMKYTLIEDIHERELGKYEMPTVHDFNFTNSSGTEITGCYLLPPGFDEKTAEKGKTPMLVYYYGGCSPVSRYFSTSYSFPALAAQGYVVYILQPRGCSGFGQEFSAWHGNTAGDPQTKDIIEGTKAFLAAHPYINEKKLGSFGASYGGFMTMYLQTKTDMFAAAWSHAGISNHTSYWGFGYWGYTYSQVSMPGTYPWTHKELYVDHSPLFNVDKIKTPLLFTHGTDDRNVPVIESSQMFTALRLLGKPTAYVTFQKEGHHVQQYTRQRNWQDTFMAWFDKWLKDDSSWWDSIYKEVKL